MADNDYDYELKSAQISNPSFFQAKWRVKLYHLNMTGQWDDMGTGHVSIKKEDEDYYITMVSEINNETMFELKLMGEMDFHRQRGTILTWKNKKEEEDDDTAISFQDKEGIREVWRFLCSLKGTEPQEEYYELDEEDDEILPEPTVENLPYIAREIRPDIPPNKVIKILDYISLNKGAYIKKLGEVLDQEEKKIEEKKSEITKTTADDIDIREIDPKNSQFENLSLIFTIFKNIFFIADQNILELLLSDDLYLITFGALEYDFESQKMIKHRQFFKEIAQFKNILNIEDPGMLSKIHLNHRLAYLRDTAIGRFIEELTIKHINIIIHYGNSDIIQYFLNNKHLIKRLIEMMQSEDIDEKGDSVLFILELISCTKDLIQTRLYFYETLCELNILESLEKTLIDVTHYSSYNKFLKSLKEDKLPEEDRSIEENSKREKIKINSIEILINVLTVVPSKYSYLFLDTLKAYITSKPQKTKEHPLLSELCNILIHQENFGIKYEIGELLKSLLDNEINEKKSEFYDLFYNKCLKNLVDFLLIPIKEEFKYEMTSSKQIIIEILCHCLKQNDGQRVRYWAIHNDLINKVMELLQASSKVLKLQAIKFIKCVFINDDENLNKIVINNDCLSPIMDLFGQNRKKDNLILSTILDLFDYIRKQNIKKIISYLFEKHYDFFYNESNKPFFSNLIVKYEQGLEQFSAIKVNTEADEKMKYPGWNSREISAREDEDYFDKEEEEEENEDDIFKKEENNNLNIIHDETRANFNKNLSEEPEVTPEFLGKKKSSETELINIYAQDDEADEISKAIACKKKKLEDSSDSDDDM